MGNRWKRDATLPSQMKPCWMRPHSMSLQWWQYVGLWKVFLQKLWPCAASGWSVEPATDAISPIPRSRQIFTVNSHLAQAYYRSMWSRNRTRTCCGRRVSLPARVTCLRRISPSRPVHSWPSLSKRLGAHSHCVWCAGRVDCFALRARPDRRPRPDAPVSCPPRPFPADGHADGIWRASVAELLEASLKSAFRQRYRLPPDLAPFQMCLVQLNIWSTSLLILISRNNYAKYFRFSKIKQTF